MMIVKPSDETACFVSTVLRIPKVDLDKIDVLAAHRRMSRAALIRESILDKIEQYSKILKDAD